MVAPSVFVLRMLHARGKAKCRSVQYKVFKEDLGVRAVERRRNLEMKNVKHKELARTGGLDRWIGSDGRKDLRGDELKD